MKAVATTSSILLLLSIAATTSAKFDPYQLNGGLVTAVAGKDYVLIASDTRLTDGGYGINSRRYLSGRIWSASSSSLLQSSLACSPSVASSSWNVFPAQFEPDGSLSMPPRNSLNMPSQVGVDENELSVMSNSLHQVGYTSTTQTNLPVLIGSAGCASDCESLKRRVRLEIDALEFDFPTGVTLGVQSIANLLQQVLYGRRGFPFYSFCVVAGIDNRDCDGGTGAVYVYDAIGSFERVAVGCSGTARELLQPILDRLFSESSKEVSDSDAGSQLGHHDVMSVSVTEQRMGVAGSLRPPVRTTVNCSWEEAVHNVARGYQAVAEREISVEDEIVICVLKTSGSQKRAPTLDMINFKLKKH